MTRRPSKPFWRLVQLVWILGFLVGTTTHVIDLIARGLDAYEDYTPPVRVFWASLTVLDPLTVVLLALRRPVGVILGLVVILADIAVNWTVFATYPDTPIWGILNQTAFAVILVTTAPGLARRMKDGVLGASRLNP